MCNNCYSFWKGESETQLKVNFFFFINVFLKWLSVKKKKKKIHLPIQEILEMQVWSPGREDPLEEEVATHSSTLAQEIPWTKEPGGL